MQGFYLRNLYFQIWCSLGTHQKSKRCSFFVILFLLMSNTSQDLASSTTTKQPAGPSAISKQVLKTNPIPQPLQTSSNKGQFNRPQSPTMSTDKNMKIKPTQPLRSTKVSQKLVLFPPSEEEASKNEAIDLQFEQLHDVDDYYGQQDPRGIPLPIESTLGSRTQAERLTKNQREIALLPRAAAYYTGEGYDLNRLRPFLRQHHRVSPRLYDECLYAPYHFPLRTLRPDKENLFNIRVRSNVPTPPNSRRNTEDYEEDHFERERRPDDKQEDLLFDDDDEKREQQQQQNTPREPFKGGEIFIFDYGVVVFWNFRRAEELLMLEDFMKFLLEPFRDNPEEDMQIEELHFQYDTSQMKPRIFNDMITLKSGNHMIKLTISHGLSQSAVVARYEDIMDKTIEDTKLLPKEMAETGRLGKTRTEITKINGELFNLRMNINLVSNVLGKSLILTAKKEGVDRDYILSYVYLTMDRYT